jgi:hypothetical protein
MGAEKPAASSAAARAGRRREITCVASAAYLNATCRRNPAHCDISKLSRGYLHCPLENLCRMIDSEES